MLLGLYITFLWYGMYRLVFTRINQALGFKRAAPKDCVFSCWDKLIFRGESVKTNIFHKSDEKDRAQKWLDIRSKSHTFTRHHSRHSIFQMADEESKTSTSLEKPQGCWYFCLYFCGSHRAACTFAVSLTTSAIIWGIVVVVSAGISKTILSKSAANCGKCLGQKYHFLLCVRKGLCLFVSLPITW